MAWLICNVRLPHIFSCQSKIIFDQHVIRGRYREFRLFLPDRSNFVCRTLRPDITTKFVASYTPFFTLEIYLAVWCNEATCLFRLWLNLSSIIW